MPPTPQPAITHPDFPHEESTLATHLGVSREVIRKARGTEGKDFVRGDRGVILWSQDAAARVVGAYQVEFPKNGVPTELTVAYVAMPAPYTIACVENGTPAHLRSQWCVVRVRHDMRHLFLPGMRILAERGPDLAWRYLGAAGEASKPGMYPRRRGVW
jgi:hypothetical protein